MVGRVVNRLDDLGGEDDRIDMRRSLLPGLNATDEPVDLILEHAAEIEFRRGFDQCAVLRGVEGEVRAVFQPDAAFVAEEVDEHLFGADILRPCAVQGNGRAFRADEGRDKIVDVIRAVIFRRTCPHFEEGVILHVFAQLAVSLAGDGLRLRIARTVHHDIEEVNAPIDKRAAAGNGFGREGAAETRDRAVRTEAGIYVIQLAEIAVLDHFSDSVYAFIVTVDHSDIERFARFVLNLLHFQRFCVGAGRRFSHNTCFPARKQSMAMEA